MEFNVNKVDDANAVISSTISAQTIEKNIDKVAKQAAKTMDIQGFRKGKVPVAIVKQRYANKLREDAEGEVVRTILTDSLKQLNIKNEDIVGEPTFSKYDKKEDGTIEVEIKVSCKPNVELGDYKALVPEVKLEAIDKKDIDSRIEDMAKQSAPLEKIKRKRMVREKDFAVIDFEGFVDGVAFDGGKAEKYALEIGSNSFIPGFEEQIIGMKYEEEKDITVTFPESYQSKDLAGKEAVFKVKLHEIQEKVPAQIDDEFAAKMLPNEENATVEMLKQKIEEQMQAETKGVYYRNELKPLYLDKLVDELKFALPDTVVDQEINFALNNKVRTMKEDEIKELQEDASKVESIRDELKEDAQKSVKATFIVDALAKAEGVEVSDQEVSQIIYFEAMQMGQNPQDVLKQYQDAGYLPAIKMSIIEDKVVNKLFDEKLGN